MSAYTTLKTQLHDAEGICYGIETLLKLTPLMDTAGIQLVGYPGHRDPVAQIAVKADALRKAGIYAHDIGFSLQEDGTYKFLVNDMDEGKFNRDWLTDLSALHNEKVATKKAQAMGRRIVTRNERRVNGRLSVQLVAR